MFNSNVGMCMTTYHPKFGICYCSEQPAPKVLVVGYPGYRYKPEVELDYILKAEEKALTFQVTKQSQAITDFLKKNRFMATNGLIIAVDEFPEFKDSTNHLYLRGSDSFRNLKLDTTPFGSIKIRDGKEKMIRQALRELVQTVQTWVNRNYGF